MRQDNCDAESDPRQSVPGRVIERAPGKVVDVACRRAYPIRHHKTRHREEEKPRGACVLVAGESDRESISEKARVREKKKEKIVSFMNLAWNSV